MEKEVKIRRIVPARSWNYMYAYTDKGDYFIYSHHDRVSFFANRKAEGISNFQEIVTKLTTFKYFNENSDNCIGNLGKVDFDSHIANIIKFGTCLISDDFQTNYKADVLVDNLNHEVTLKLYDAGDYSYHLTSDMQLPDLKENGRIKEKEALFQSFKNPVNEKLIDLIYEQPNFFKKIISFGFPFTLEELDKYFSILCWNEVSKNSRIFWSTELIQKHKKNLNWKEFSKHIKLGRELINSHSEEIDWESFSSNTLIDWRLLFQFYVDKLNWAKLSANPSFPWTGENIIRYSSKIDWYLLCMNKSVEFNIDILRQYSDKVDWNIIATNSGNWWTKDIIDEFKDKLRWRNLLVYGSFWTIELIEYFEEYIKREYGFAELSKNPNVTWTEALLERYKENLGWGWLSENPGLPWSNDLIEKYNDKWNWSNLGAIVWDVDFAKTNIDKFYRMNGSSSLWTNNKVIKSENFCIEHKDILFPKNKGTGMMRFMDTSGNKSLPVSVPFFYQLKENLDWDVELLQMVKETGKFENLISEITIETLDLILETSHFEK